jgi:hypothetical protein
MPTWIQKKQAERLALEAAREAEKASLEPKPPKEKKKFGAGGALPENKNFGTTTLVMRFTPKMQTQGNDLQRMKGLIEQHHGTGRIQIIREEQTNDGVLVITRKGIDAILEAIRDVYDLIRETVPR